MAVVFYAQYTVKQTVFAAQNAWLHIHDAIDETSQQSLKQNSAKVSNGWPKYDPWYVDGYCTIHLNTFILIKWYSYKYLIFYSIYR